FTAELMILYAPRTRASSAAKRAPAARHRDAPAQTNTTDSNNRRTLFRVEIFPAQEQAPAVQRAHKTPRSSTQPVRRRRLPRRRFPCWITLTLQCPCR